MVPYYVPEVDCIGVFVVIKIAKFQTSKNDYLLNLFNQDLYYFIVAWLVLIHKLGYEISILRLRAFEYKIH